MTDSPSVLLDTCVVIYASLGDEIGQQATNAIREASSRSQLYISPISAWEVGMLMSKRRLKSPLTPDEFLRRFLEAFGASYAELSPKTLIDSSFLPDFPHGDPTDRTLVATARNLDMIMVTSDRSILQYAEQGHLRALAC